MSDSAMVISDGMAGVQAAVQNSVVARKRLIEEINRLPEDKLAEVYTIIHYFRVGLAASQPESTVMHYAGCWQDWEDEGFADFVQETTTRRQKNSSQRHCGVQ